MTPHDEEAALARQARLAGYLPNDEAPVDGGGEGDALDAAIDAALEGKLILGAAAAAAAHRRRHPRTTPVPTWREILHPRDRRGQFTSKPSSGVAYPPGPRRYPPRAPTLTEQRMAAEQNQQPQLIDLTGPRLIPVPGYGDLPVDPVFVAAANRINKRQAEELAAGHDTRSVFDKLDGVDGKYRTERRQLHEEIIAEFLNQPGSIPPPGRKPRLIMVGGIPGAGKTYTINSDDGQRALGISLDEFVMMNPDEVKEAMMRRGMVPEYEGLSANEAATLVHLESVDIVAQISRRAMAQGRNVMWDSSMRNQTQAEEFIDYAAGRDYDIWAMIVEAPLENALRQAMSRYLKGGRFMPLDLIAQLRHEEWGTQPRAVFETLKDSPKVGRWFRFANDGKSPPRLVDSSQLVTA